jgi:hypothetical protein
VKIFLEEEATILLSISVTYNIKLQPGTTLPYRPLLSILALELKVLRSYLENYQAKGWIRSLSRLAGAPILFILKKNRTLYLYINY